MFWRTTGEWKNWDFPLNKHNASTCIDTSPCFGDKLKKTQSLWSFRKPLIFNLALAYWENTCTRQPTLKNKFYGKVSHILSWLLFHLIWKNYVLYWYFNSKSGIAAFWLNSLAQKHNQISNICEFSNCWLFWFYCPLREVLTIAH